MQIGARVGMAPRDILVELDAETGFARQDHIAGFPAERLLEGPRGRAGRAALDVQRGLAAWAGPREPEGTEGGDWPVGRNRHTGFRASCRAALPPDRPGALEPREARWARKKTRRPPGWPAGSL